MSDRLPNRPEQPRWRAPGAPPPEPASAGKGEGPKPVTAEALVSAVSSLPAMPATVLKVMQITGSGESSAKAVSDVIRSDPGFSVRMLRLANSAHYGLARSVDTITDAVVLLGINQIRDLAIAAGSHEQLNKELKGYGLGSGDLWRHSFACGIAAQMIATRQGCHDPEEAFVIGLLHDIGKVAMSSFLAPRLGEVLTAVVREKKSFPDAERATMGFDSATVGGLIAAKWGLASALSEGITLRPDPGRKGAVVMLAAIAHVANAVCLALGVGLGIDGLAEPVKQNALKTIGLNVGDFDGLIAQLVVDLAAEPLFTISDGDNAVRRAA